MGVERIVEVKNAYEKHKDMTHRHNYATKADATDQTWEWSGVVIHFVGNRLYPVANFLEGKIFKKRLITVLK